MHLYLITPFLFWPFFTKAMNNFEGEGAADKKVFWLRFLTMIHLLSQTIDKFRSYDWKYVRAFIVKGETFFIQLQGTTKERQKLQIGVKSKRLYSVYSFLSAKTTIIGAKNKHIHPYSQIIFFIAISLKKKSQLVCLP